MKERHATNELVVVPFAAPPRPVADDPLLTTVEAAELLGCKTRKVQYLVAQGTLPAVRYMRGYRFRRSAILSFITRHEF